MIYRIFKKFGKKEIIASCDESLGKALSIIEDLKTRFPNEEYRIKPWTEKVVSSAKEAKNICYTCYLYHNKKCSYCLCACCTDIDFSTIENKFDKTPVYDPLFKIYKPKWPSIASCPRKLWKENK
jgi:hypothetical protein